MNEFYNHVHNTCKWREILTERSKVRMTGSWRNCETAEGETKFALFLTSVLHNYSYLTRSPGRKLKPRPAHFPAVIALSGRGSLSEPC